MGTPDPHAAAARGWQRIAVGRPPETSLRPTERPDEPEQRVLVLAPTGRDAELTSQVLRRQGFTAAVCRDEHELVCALACGAGTLLLADEALDPVAVDLLVQQLDRQPFWSDLPILVLTLGEKSPDRVLEAFGPVGNVSLLERPVAISTLSSAVRAALRARQRQYEVRDLVRRLGEMDRRKDEFMAMLGHELRNPLSVIRNALAVLQEIDGSPRTSRQQQVIERQVAHLTYLLEDLLNITRVNQGKITLDLEPCELNREVRACLDGITNGSEPQERILFEPAIEELPVSADPVRLEQIVCNLVLNALKYSPDDTVIRVVTERREGEAVLQVRDHGIGIDPAMLTRIFEPFTQAAVSLARSQGGLGLGLPLVKRLVEMHGGTIVAHSAGENCGSEFEVRLPLSTEAGDEERSCGSTGRTSGRDTDPDEADGQGQLKKILDQL